MSKILKNESDHYIIDSVDFRIRLIMNISALDWREENELNSLIRKIENYEELMISDSDLDNQSKNGFDYLKWSHIDIKYDPNNIDMINKFAEEVANIYHYKIAVNSVNKVFSIKFVASINYTDDEEILNSFNGIIFHDKQNAKSNKSPITIKFKLPKDKNDAIFWKNKNSIGRFYSTVDVNSNELISDKITFGGNFDITLFNIEKIIEKKDSNGDIDRFVPIQPYVIRISKSNKKLPLINVKNDKVNGKINVKINNIKITGSKYKTADVMKLSKLFYKFFKANNLILPNKDSVIDDYLKYVNKLIDRVYSI